MKRLLAISLFAAAAAIAPGFAQEEDGGTRLERLLEDALSGAGRDVSVQGFRGALTGRAEMALLTIADESGVWLSVENAVLDWNRGALFRGRFEVSELTAERIEVIRRPVADTSDPLTPEASGSGLRLPELPVAIILEEVAAETLVVGTPVIGQALTATLGGRVRLEGGEGEATISLVRTEGPRGEFSLDASYSNATSVLAVDLLFDEAGGGIVATLTGLPGAPAVRLSVNGEGPIDDFSANVALATDGTERFGGTVSTSASGGERHTSAALEGDLRPLVESEYRPFFGAQSSVAARAIRRADGETDVESLELITESLSIAGRLVLAPGGPPRLIELAGELGEAGGTPVLLPIPGPETRLESARVEVAFDAAAGPDWRGLIEARRLDRQGFSAEELRLEGTGRIGASPASVDADLAFAARALDLGDPAAEAALGEEVTGRAEFSWAEGEPLVLSRFEIEGETYRASATGSVDNVLDTFDVAGSASVEAEDIAVFSGLAGRTLEGAVTASLSGSAGLFSGFVDLQAGVRGENIAVGEPRLDPYLVGTTTTEVEIRRTTAGVFLDTFDLEATGVNARATAQLSSENGALEFDARVADLSPLADGLAGEGSASLSATMTGGTWTWDLDSRAMATGLVATGTLSGLDAAPIVTAAGEVTAGDFGAFSVLLEREIAGSAAFEFSGRAEPTERRYSISAEGSLGSTSTGFQLLDDALTDETDFALAAALDGDAVSVDSARIASRTVNAAGSGSWAPDFSRFDMNATVEVPELSIFFEDIEGPAIASIAIVPEASGGPWNLDLTVEGAAASGAVDAVLADLQGIPEIAGNATLSVPDLSPVGEILGRPLGGSLSMDAAGRLVADLSEFDVTASGAAERLRTGIDPLDRILTGRTAFEIDAERSAGTIEISRAFLEGTFLSADARGRLGDETNFDFTARLADIAPLADGFSGPLSAEGQARSAGGGPIDVSATLRGPAGAAADIAGTVATDASNVALDIDGAAPLGLINGIIAPRAAAGIARFDLRLDGRPALDSLSGRVTTQDAILSAPILDIAIERISADVSLRAGRAEIDLTGRNRGGGRIAVNGGIGLGAGLPADLTARLDNIILSDPALYQTRLDARLSLSGPLSNGARIAGRVDVEDAELRIPSSVARGGGLPEMTHVDEPASVRSTRARAGLLATRDNGGGPAAAFVLDILVNARDRIFVRGRGLDAELGGQLRLAGTTRDVVPSGRFDLIRGRLDILGRRLSLTEGSIDVTGALDPRIRLVAETRAEDTDVSVIVEGRVSDPEIRFESRPQLPEDEILALLIFGRGIESLSPLQVARLAAAVATLRNPEEGLLGGVRSGAGLADLDVTTTDDGGAAVRAGTYIGENVYTDVTVDTEGDAEINLNLDLSNSITVRGSTSNTGRSSVGVFFERDY